MNGQRKYNYQNIVTFCCGVRQKAELGCFPGFWLKWPHIGRVVSFIYTENTWKKCIYGKG